MADIADLVGVTPAEVYGTATFYDMLHTEPVGTHLVAVCTNIACLLNGAAELLEHAESTLGVNAGGTTADGSITLEEAECLADCDRAPCVQVNHRFVGAQTPETFDRLVAELRSGARSADIPDHGTLNRVRRTTGLEADPALVASERAAMAEAQAQRAAAAAAAKEAERGQGRLRDGRERLLMAVTEAPRIVTSRLASRRLPHPRAVPGHRRATRACARRSR